MNKNRFLTSVCLWHLMAWVGGIETAHATDRDQLRSKTMLRTMCGGCHAVGTAGPGLHVYAPPFRSLGEDKLYDKGFERRLQDGLTTSHRDMPTFRFNRRDAEAAVNYLRSIQDRKVLRNR